MTLQKEEAVTLPGRREAPQDRPSASGVALQSGTVLAHSYRLLHPIGEGGMGRVWVAEHIALKRRVAIKVMSEQTLWTPIARALFDCEAQATAKVESPHVIRVLDFDVTSDGFPFLVLELLEGQTLEDRIAESGPLSLAHAHTVLEQVCHALDAVHSCGVLHRDIKPENVFLVGGNAARIDVRLLDFGVATLKEHIIVTGPVGTPQYMSPEQLVGAPVDERTDLFSLAVCMYHALTGTFPFEASTYIPVAQRQPALPATLDHWFSCALAREKEERFSDAKQMLEAFVKNVVEKARAPRHHYLPRSMVLLTALLALLLVFACFVKP